MSNLGTEGFLTFNGAPLTQETITKTRHWFADNSKACIAEAESGAVFVNDLASYRRSCESDASDALVGEFDHTFTFRQRAYFIQTGESVPLFNGGA